MRTKFKPAEGALRRFSPTLYSGYRNKRKWKGEVAWCIVVCARRAMYVLWRGVGEWCKCWCVQGGGCKCCGVVCVSGVTAVVRARRAM